MQHDKEFINDGTNLDELRMHEHCALVIGQEGSIFDCLSCGARMDQERSVVCRIITSVTAGHDRVKQVVVREEEKMK